MGFFDFIKNKKEVEPTDFEYLTKEGELPFGWIYRNKDFVDQINAEYSHFLNMWLDSKHDTPKEQYAALKSFVLYLEDVEKLCKSKGECFEFWFCEILISPSYLAERKKELEELTANLEELQEKYYQKQRFEEEKQRKIIEMKSDVILLLKENDGILQSDFWKLFDDEICRAAATDIVYALLKEGKIQRTKSGRSYTLNYRG